MGQEIVYCARCQTRLMGSDFQTGKAFRHQGQVLCPACAPEEAKAPQEQEPPPQETSRRSTRTIPVVPGPPKTTRKSTTVVRRSSKTPLVVGGSVAVGILLLIIIVAAGSGRPKRGTGGGEAPAPETPAAPPSKTSDPANVEASPAPRRAPPPGRTRRESPEDVIRELEAMLASSEDPTAILMRCDQVRSALRGTPQAAKLKRIEAEANRLKATAGGGKKLDAMLGEIRMIVASEFLVEREAEVRGMLAAALKVAGPRRPEVEKLQRDFEAALKAARKETSAPKPKPAPSAAPLAVKFQLIDRNTKKPIPGFDPLRDGATIDLSNRSADRLEIRAIVKGGAKCVRFDLDGKERYSVEGWAPWELDAGEDGPRAWANAGKHTVTAVPYSKRNLTGVAGKPLTVTFTVVGK